MIVLLSQGGQAADQLFVQILPWIGILAILIILGGGIAVWLRKRMAVNADDSSAGFILADLREMRDRGDISPEEFENAKARMITSMSASTKPRTDDTEDATDRASASRSPDRITPSVPPRRRPKPD